MELEVSKVPYHYTLIKRKTLIIGNARAGNPIDLGLIIYLAGIQTNYENLKQVKTEKTTFGSGNKRKPVKDRKAFLVGQNIQRFVAPNNKLKKKNTLNVRQA